MCPQLGVWLSIIWILPIKSFWKGQETKKAFKVCTQVLFLMGVIIHVEKFGE